MGGPAGLSPSSPELSPAVKAREAEPNVSRAANGCTPPDGRHKASLTGRGAGAASDGGAAGVRRSEPAGTGRNRPVPPPRAAPDLPRSPPLRRALPPVPPGGGEGGEGGRREDVPCGGGGGWERRRVIKSEFAGIGDFAILGWDPACCRAVWVHPGLN